MCVTQRWALHAVIKRHGFLDLYLLFSISIHSWDTTTSAFRKQTDAIWKFYIRFRVCAFCRHKHVILHRSNKFYTNWTISDRVMTLCRFSKMAAIWRPYHRKSTSAFWFYDVSHLERQSTICIPNVDQMSQSTAAEILLLPLPKRKRSPYWNCTSGYHIDLFTAVGIVILH